MAGFGRSNSLSINTGGGGGGLFGNSTTQPQSSGGLFASSQQAQSDPARSQSKPNGGLFGSSTTQPAQPQSGGLFGGALGANNPALGQPKPSLFGSAAQQTTAPSLFVASSTQQTQPATSTLFGSTQQPPQHQQTSLFSGMNTQKPPTTSSGPTFGAPHSGTSAQQPIQLTLESIRGTTRFNDLHPELQTLIQQFDEGIQRKISYCNQVREALPGSQETIATIAPDVAYIQNLLSTVESGLDNDSTNIAHLKDIVKKDAVDATLSFRAIENQRLPAQFHYRNSANLAASTAKVPTTSPLESDDPTKPVDLMSYFSRRTHDLSATLDIYQRQIYEIESHLRAMETGTVEKAQQLTGARNSPRDQRRELVDALKAIEGAILDAAKQVGQVRDNVTKQTLGNVGAALL